MFERRPALTSSAADAPEQWLDQHGAALYRYALVRTRDPHKAEEAVQETLLAALEARDRFSGNAAVRTWLIGILKHKLMDQFRREAREQPLEEDLAMEIPDESRINDMFAPDGHWRERLADWGDPEDALRQNQFLLVLQRCLDLLPKRLARLFLLREVHEESSEDICRDLAITPANLWTMLYRTRLGLRQCLEQSWAG
jgi:RNA polymerase sigma-70 factor (ECF subfamily)